MSVRSFVSVTFVSHALTVQDTEIHFTLYDRVVVVGLVVFI